MPPPKSICLIASFRMTSKSINLTIMPSISTKILVSTWIKAIKNRSKLLIKLFSIPSRRQINKVLKWMIWDTKANKNCKHKQNTERQLLNWMRWLKEGQAQILDNLKLSEEKWKQSLNFLYIITFEQIYIIINLKLNLWNFIRFVKYNWE